MKHRVLAPLLSLPLVVLFGSSAAAQGESYECEIACAQPGAILGTSGRDRLTGTPQDDIICGLGGDDRIRGRGGADILCGGPGRDRISGGAGNDFIDGGLGRDRLDGRSGSDRIVGGQDNDSISAGSGNDCVDGGPGFDKGRGRSGRDTCVNTERTEGCEVFTGTCTEPRPTPAPTPAPTPGPTGGPTPAPTPQPTPVPTPNPNLPSLSTLSGTTNEDGRTSVLLTVPPGTPPQTLTVKVGTSNGVQGQIDVTVDPSAGDRAAASSATAGEAARVLLFADPDNLNGGTGGVSTIEVVVIDSLYRPLPDVDVSWELLGVAPTPVPTVTPGPTPLPTPTAQPPQPYGSAFGVFVERYFGLIQ